LDDRGGCRDFERREPCAQENPEYRPENRYLVFQCKQHTLDLASELWRVIDQEHKKRNLAEYEGD
jgi:hypothetical protein